MRRWLRNEWKMTLGTPKLTYLRLACLNKYKDTTSPSIFSFLENDVFKQCDLTYWFIEIYTVLQMTMVTYKHNLHTRETTVVDFYYKKKFVNHVTFVTSKSIKVGGFCFWRSVCYEGLNLYFYHDCFVWNRNYYYHYCYLEQYRSMVRWICLAWCQNQPNFGWVNSIDETSAFISTFELTHGFQAPPQ